MQPRHGPLREEEPVVTRDDVAPNESPGRVIGYVIDHVQVAAGELHPPRIAAVGVKAAVVVQTTVPSSSSAKSPSFSRR